MKSSLILRVWLSFFGSSLAMTSIVVVRIFVFPTASVFQSWPLLAVSFCGFQYDESALLILQCFDSSSLVVVY